MDRAERIGRPDIRPRATAAHGKGGHPESRGEPAGVAAKRSQNPKSDRDLRRSFRDMGPDGAVPGLGAGAIGAPG